MNDSFLRRLLFQAIKALGGQYRFHSAAEEVSLACGGAHVAEAN